MSDEPKKSPATVWTNRITHYSMEAPDQLLFNPKNFRRHPIHQKQILDAVAGEVGIVAPVIQNDRTGHLLDGHMRVEEAMHLGVDKLPVAHVDLSEEDEDKVLATLDAISAMAFEDPALKAELLKDIRTHDDHLSDYLEREYERQMAEAGSLESLDDLGERYGKHDPTAFWPVIRIRVPPETRARFINYFQGLSATTDEEKLNVMLDKLGAPYVSADAVSEVASD